MIQKWGLGFLLRISGIGLQLLQVLFESFLLLDDFFYCCALILYFMFTRLPIYLCFPPFFEWEVKSSLLNFRPSERVKKQHTLNV